MLLQRAESHRRTHAKEVVEELQNPDVLKALADPSVDGGSNGFNEDAKYAMMLTPHAHSQSADFDKILLLERLLDLYRCCSSALASEAMEALTTYEDMNDKSTITHNSITVRRMMDWQLESFNRIILWCIGCFSDGRDDFPPAELLYWNVRYELLRQRTVSDEI
jgi:hypothetical protein